MSAIFVTGTDTGIGKTLVSAWLVHHWQAFYWKPIQTGIIEDDDAATVASLARIPPARILPNEVTLDAPLSPLVAAAREGKRIDLDRFRLPPQRPLVVEGAGGVLVPINETEFMADLMARLGLPVLVVARSTLGTINHTLMTLEALRRRNLSVLGIVLNGPPDRDNRATIERLGQIAVLAELPPLDRVDAEGLRRLPAPDFA